MQLIGVCYAAIFIILLSLFPGLTTAQTKGGYNQKATRILFILDASGSMKEKWGDKSKFELAEDLLLHVVDSVEKANPKVEFGLRVLGHQFPKSAMNCTDTKLEVEFSGKSFERIKTTLERIHPQGQTPLAYTLSQAVNDFPKDSLSTNAIILITDGTETCHGNPCDVARQFQERRISLKPFIIGLGFVDTSKHYFDCLGNFYDVSDSYQFTHVMGAVISQALNNTTLQVNLLNAYGVPSETNIEMTFYDHKNHRQRYNFVHSLNSLGNPDTLRIDPIGHYDLVVHSLPPVEKKDIELVPGIHNTVAVDVPQGNLSLEVEGVSTSTPPQCLVRESGSQNILYVQDFNSSVKYITGDYDLEILTLPRIMKYSVKIAQGKTVSIKVPPPGTVTFTPSQLGTAELLAETDNGLQKVHDFYSVQTSESVQVQPGKYLLIFRPDKGKQSILTQKAQVQVTANKIIIVKL